MTDSLGYEFAGTDNLVDLRGCDGVAKLLPSVFRTWPYEQAKETANLPEPLFKTRQPSERSTHSLPEFDTDQILKDPLNITCFTVAHPARARPRRRRKLVRMQKFIPGLSNKPYLYLNLPDGTLTKRGKQLPISTIMMLDRVCGAGMEIAEASSKVILRCVILQKFSRHIHPAPIQSVLNHLVEYTQSFGRSGPYCRNRQNLMVLLYHSCQRCRTNSRKP